MRLNVWTPLPPSSSGVADYAVEQLHELARSVEVTAVAQDPAAVSRGALPDGVSLVSAASAPDADLDLYHLGNSPAHGFVYRRALEQPGVVLLHDRCLHHLVLSETVEKGNPHAYLRAMRREYGERGTFVARQVARALGGELWPARYPLSEPVLESSLGAVVLSSWLEREVSAAAPGWPVLHLPHHFRLPLASQPTREQARRRLGLRQDAFLVSSPGLATKSKRLESAVRAVARLSSSFPQLELVIAGGVEPGLPLERWAQQARLGEGLHLTGRLTLEELALHLVAADVVLCLRFPSHGEMSGALVRALGVGRACLVSAETPAAFEFPEGVVALVEPGPLEQPHLEALLELLVTEPSWKQRLELESSSFIASRHDLKLGVDSLVGFLDRVLVRREELLGRIRQERAAAGTRLGRFLEEVRFSARELGLSRAHPLAIEVLRPLAEGRP